MLGQGKKWQSNTGRDGSERRQPMMFHYGSSGGGSGAEKVPGGTRGAVHHSVVTFCVVLGTAMKWT